MHIHYTLANSMPLPTLEIKEFQGTKICDKLSHGWVFWTLDKKPDSQKKSLTSSGLIAKNLYAHWCYLSFSQQALLDKFNMCITLCWLLCYILLILLMLGGLTTSIFFLLDTDVEGFKGFFLFPWPSKKKKILLFLQGMIICGDIHLTLI